MSQENVELTLRINEAWNRRDVEAAVALSDPKGEWSGAFERITGGGTYRGHAGVRQYFEDLTEFSEESHVEYSEVHDLGDQVLAVGRVWFRFASGVDLDHDLAALHTWRRARSSRPGPPLGDQRGLRWGSRHGYRCSSPDR